MNRILMGKLREWKKKKDRLPLIIKGARQVGKTWLLTEFGRTEFTDTVYINFENTPAMKDLFEGMIEPVKIIDILGAFHGRKSIPSLYLRTHQLIPPR